MGRYLGLWATLALCVASAPGGYAFAEGSVVGAAVDAITDAQSRTDGGLATAQVVSGSSTAAVEADLTRVRTYGSDNTHFSTGAPGSSGASDFYFEVLGAIGVVDLTFHFATLGSFDVDLADTFARNGSFSLLLTSATGPSPYVNGGFTDVQCLGCGGRLFGGGITTLQDYYGPGAVTSTDWLGENPGDYALVSSFVAGAPSAGRLQMQAAGGAGRASWDFEVRLTSITTNGSARGLSLYVPSTGQSFAVTGAGVPEPAAWALMILGFGAAGAQLRTRRSRSVGTLPRC